MAYLFEVETCSRCKGTGEYSYCQVYGTRCFKCAGAKVVLTKRGRAAQDFLTKLQTVSLPNLKIGDIIECTGLTNGGSMFRYKAPVVSIEKSTSVHNEAVEYMLVKTEHSKFGAWGVHTPKETEFRIWPNQEDNVIKALAYQANLTKAGSKRKRALFDRGE